MISPSEPETRLVGTFWIVDLAEPLPTAPPPRLPATFLRLGPEDAGELAQAMDGDATPGRDKSSDGPGRDKSGPYEGYVRQRFSAGKHCYAARIENEIATYGWVTFDQENIGELGLNFHLAPGDAYIWDCATLPAYRGQRLYAALLAYIVRALHEMGLRRAWIGADAANLPSQAGMVRAGFRPVVDMVLSPASPGLYLRGRLGESEQLVSDIRAALR